MVAATAEYAEPSKPISIPALVCRLGRLGLPDWRPGLVIAIGLAGEMAFSSALPFSFKFIVDDGLIARDHDLLIAIVAGLAVGAIVVSTAGLLRDWLFARLAARIVGDLRATLFDHLQRLSIDFYARARSGDLLSRFSSDVGAIEAAGSMQRIDDLLGQVPRIVDRPGATSPPRLRRSVVFEDVSFGYDDASRGLSGVGLEIGAEESVAVVGASGSGKSTVIGLLMRLHEPGAGRITLDGIDLRTATQASLRAQIGVVLQDSYLFAASIADNIRLGRLDATRGEIETAARAAEIHDLIASLPAGYDTQVGERGRRRSGGQRQRIAIARAILRDPPILVLDEATSALDAATEVAINDTIARIGRGRMVVTVTHRLTAAAEADRIFVLDQGRLVDSGRHDELLGRDGPYRRLWEKQSGVQVNAAGDRATVSPEWLRRVRLLDPLDDAMLRRTVQLFSTERHPAGRMIIHQGDHADRFYILVRGAVEVLADDGEHPARRIAVFEDGDHFGEIALLRDVPRTASIRTLMPCTLLSLQREQFDQLLRQVPELRARMEDVHSARLSASGGGEHIEERHA